MTGINSSGEVVGYDLGNNNPCGGTFCAFIVSNGNVQTLNYTHFVGSHKKYP